LSTTDYNGTGVDEVGDFDDPTNQVREEEQETTHKSQVRRSSVKQDKVDHLQQLLQTEKMVVISKTYYYECDEFKDLLKQKGIQVKMVELDEDKRGLEIEHEMIEKYGECKLPSVFIEGRLFGGTRELKASLENGKLLKVLNKAGVIHKIA
jgi:glutaredoxin 3